MSLIAWKKRRYTVPAVLVTLCCFMSTLLPPGLARADYPSSLAPIAEGTSDGTGGPPTLGGVAAHGNSPEALANVDLATGAAQTDYPFQFSRARGDAQPSLGLHYSSASGVGFAGMSWSLDVPSVVRKGASGIPRFIDDVLAVPSTLSANLSTDDYLFDGKLLVPVAVLAVGGDGSGGVATGTVQSGETFPYALLGQAPGAWAYFHTDVDDGARYFFNGQTWVLQSKSGRIMQFGSPIDGQMGGSVELVDTHTFDAIFTANPSSQSLANPIYRWNLVRDTDASGNSVYYVWSDEHQLFSSTTSPQAIQYLTDIYDTPPLGNLGPLTPQTPFAHHVHLTWSLAQYPEGFPFNDPPSVTPSSWSPIWRAVPFAQLSQVDVTSATLQSQMRSLVREYQLAYTFNATQTRDFLTSVVVVGDCMTETAGAGVGEDANGLVPTTSVQQCATLPATTYQYFGISPVTSAQPQILAKNTVPSSVSGHTIALLDVTGDARADYLTADESNQLHLTTNDTHVPWAALQNAAVASVPPAASYNQQSQLIFGDWLSRGHLTMLVPNYQLTGSGGVFTGTWESPPISAYEIQGFPAFVDLTSSLPPVPSAVTQLDPSLVSNQRAVDVDGDSLPDLTLVPVQSGSSYNYETLFTLRDRSGRTYPFANSGQVYCPAPASNPSAFGYPTDQLQRTMADVDGDGLADLLVANKFPCNGSCPPGTPTPPGGGPPTPYVEFQFLPSRGDGRFGITDPSVTGGPIGCDGSFGFAIFPNQVDQQYQSDPVGSDDMAASLVRFGDLNGDEMADFAVLDSSGLSICLRYGPSLDAAVWLCTTDSTIHRQSPVPVDYSLQEDIQIADVDGSGINQVVYTAGQVGSPVTWLMSPNGSSINGVAQPRDGLLQSVSNGYGATTTLQYETLDAATSGANTTAVPVPGWVVTTATTSNGLSGPQATSVANNYGYNNPVFDARDNVFLGFGLVSVSKPGAPGDPGALVVTHFATQAAPVGAVDESLYHLSRGVPGAVEIRGLNLESQFTTSITNLNVQRRYTGLDGRSVLGISSATRHTYLWPETGPAFNYPSPVYVQGLPGDSTLDVPTNGTELRNSSSYDVFGNETLVENFGNVAQDRAILLERQWGLPSGDTSGWNYRVNLAGISYARTKFGLLPSERIFTYDYDPQGRLADVYGKLTGTAPLPPPIDGVRPAGQPPEVSHDGVVSLAHIQYDGYGNVFQVTTPNGRCRQIAYDLLYSQWPYTSTSFSGGCGSGALVTTFAYDRGLGALRSLVSAAGALTAWSYDDFGRLQSVRQPSVAALGMSSTALTADYQDTAGVHRVHFTTVAGDDSAPTSVDHYQYLDGLGDTIETIDQAGSPTTGTQWIVSGMHSRYPTGRVSTVGQVFYLQGSVNPSTLAPGTLPATSFGGATAGFTYDELGRPIASTDFLGRTSTSTYHTAALSVDLRDPEQVAGNSGATHTQAYSTVTRDGHGRVVQTKRHLVNTAQGAGDLVSSASYQATGEPTLITQSYPGGTYSRTMQYDSLGRMARNQEPNAGTWSYAYNDSGELVGTSDARGCGENLFHDGLGRVVAEDYSPCDPSQLGYTSPSLATGDGTEAFYVYDSPPGSLTASYDRAQHSTYGPSLPTCVRQLPVRSLV